MQRSPSEHRGAPPSNTRSPARDPRIKHRTGSTPGLDRDTDTGRDRVLDNRESLRRGDETSSSNTPQSTTSRLDNAVAVLNEPPDLQKAFSRHSRNALNADFLERKRSYLRHELEGARAEYDKYKKTKDKFPIPADQAQKEKSRFETEYAAVKRDESKARAAEESSAATLTKLLREILTGKDEELKRKDEEIKQKDDRYNVLSAQIAVMQGGLQDLRAQQAKAPAHPPPISKELDMRIKKLEEYLNKQNSDNATFRAISDGLKTSKQSIQDLQIDYIKKNEETRQQIDELRREQRKTSKDTIQTSSSLRLEVGALQQRIESLEHRLPSIESQLHVSEIQRAAEKEQVLQIQEASAAQRRAADDTERLRKSIHLKVEILSGEFKDGISTTKADLHSFSSELSDMRDSHLKLTGKVDGLATPTVAEGPLCASLESEITSLKCAGQDQLEKLAALDTSVEEIDTKVSSLTPQFDQIPMAIEQLDALHAQIVESNATWQGFEEKVSTEIKTIQQQVTDSFTMRPFDITSLSKTMKTMEDRLEEFNSQHTRSEEKLNSDIKSFATILSQQAAVQSRSVTKLEQEFTRYTEARTASEEQRDLALMDDIAKLRQELQEDLVTIKAAYAQRSAQTLSTDERLQISSVQIIRARVDVLEKSLEKQSHISLDLNHRYNNLTTESLARRMMGVANKALPIFEKGLQKLEADVQDLREEVAKPNSIPAEVEKTILSIQGSVESLEMTFQGKFDILAKNFTDGRDTIVKKIEELEESTARHEIQTSQSTYRESTAKNFKALETRIDNVNTKIDDIDKQIEEISSRELFPSKDRKRASIDTQGASSNGSQGPSNQPKIGNHSVMHKSLEPAGPANSTSSVSVSRVVQGSDDEDDNETNRRDLLEQFTNLAPRNATPRQPIRRGPQPNQPSTKRKRSHSQENTKDVEFSIKGRSSKGTRR